MFTTKSRDTVPAIPICLSFQRSLSLSRRFVSIRLYSPVSLRIALSFVFICSDTHIPSIRFQTSISESYKSVSKRIWAHLRTIIFSPCLLTFAVSFFTCFLNWIHLIFKPFITSWNRSIRDNAFLSLYVMHS